MKSIIIQAKSFEFEEQMHRFVSEYLQRTANFVTKNQIDEELHQDILQRLSDKLSDLQEQGKLEQKYIIQAINDLGEAEDIFAEELDFQLSEPSFQKEEKNLIFYERLQAKGRSRPQQKALFLGVYAMIADLLSWNVRVVRGIGLFLHFALSAMGFFGMEIVLSVPMYFSLALIFPRTEKEYYHRSVLNYFLTQLRDLRLLVINFFRKVWRLLCLLMPQKGGILSQIFFFGWNIVRFVGLGIWILGLAMVSIGLFSVGFYLWTGGISQTMMDISQTFPAITRRGIVIGIIFLRILIVGGFGEMFHRRLLNRSMRWILVGTGIFSASALVITIGEITMLVWTPGQEISQELNIPLQKKHNLTINLETLQGQFSSEVLDGVLFPVWQQQKVIFTPTTGESIQAVYHYDIKTPHHVRGQENFLKLVENLQKPSFKREKETLHIWLTNNEVFDQQVPWAMVSFRVELKIPQTVQFSFSMNGNRDYWYRNNLAFPERKWKPSMISCRELISYSAQHDAFYCPMQMGDSDKKNLTSVFIDQHIDELVPIKGLESERSFEDHEQGYRKIHSIDWKSVEKPLVKVSDKFLNLFIQLETSVDESWKVTIISSKIVNVEKKWNLTSERLLKYQGLESMSGILMTVEEKKATLLDQIEKLERELEVLEHEV